MPAGLDFGLVYPLWNHARGGASMLEQIIGEIGIGHVTVPIVTGELSQFRPHWFADEPYFRTEGGWHYRADAKLYGTAGVKPRIAKWLGHRDALDEVLEIAASSNLRVMFEIQPLRIPSVLEQTPQLREISAWGQSHHDAPACPSNAEFRALFEAILTDIERFAPAGYIFSASEHPTAPTPTDLRAPNTYAAQRPCFCASCRQIASAASIDAQAAALAVRGRTLATDAESPDASDNPHTAEIEQQLERYQTAIPADAARWLGRVADRFPDRLRLIKAISIVAPNWLQLHAGPHVRFTATSAVAHAAPGSSTAQQPGTFADSAEVVRWFQQHVSSGTDYFDLESIEALPKSHLTWFKQAIRFAGRM